MATGIGSQPCGACRFLRRKCTSDCIFAPYFCSEQGPASFAAIHKVFGASNVSKLLSDVPVAGRRDAMMTIAFEAQSRMKDPVYGCVSHVLALQQQVEYLQDQVMQMEAQLSENLIDNRSSSRIAENQWPNSSTDAGIGSSPFPTLPDHTSYSNFESIDGIFARQLESCRDEQVSFQNYSNNNILSHTELSDLQELALRMMKNSNNNH